MTREKELTVGDALQIIETYANILRRISEKFPCVMTREILEGNIKVLSDVSEIIVKACDGEYGRDN